MAGFCWTALLGWSQQWNSVAPPRRDTFSGGTGMKRIETLVVVAMLMLGAGVAGAQVTVTSGDGGKTVIETVTNLRYGTVTLTWAADANIAGELRPDSPYWVPGINPDGSMPLSVANEFVGKLNEKAYLGITTWSLPITVYDDASLQLAVGWRALRIRLRGGRHWKHGVSVQRAGQSVLHRDGAGTAPPQQHQAGAWAELRSFPACSAVSLLVADSAV